MPLLLNATIACLLSFRIYKIVLAQRNTVASKYDWLDCRKLLRTKRTRIIGSLISELVRNLDRLVYDFT